MKILSNRKTDVNTVELEIEVDAKTLEEAVEAVYQRDAGTISVPGFRKGKAPRRIIEKRFGEGVFVEDAVNEVYPKAYSEAVEATGIVPVAPADIEILELEDNKGFKFKATVTVKPEVTVSDYKGIKADKAISKVTEDLVDSEVQRLRERGARLVSITDRAAADGDTSIIDFEGFVDEVAFEGGKGTDHQLILGSNSFIDGFEPQIIGKNVEEEFDVNVTFPEEYHEESLAGKPAVFKVKLKEIKAQELPALDDEFAKDVSEFDTLDELKADLKVKLQETADKASQDNLENDLVSKVIENMEGEIPEVMYEGRIDQMVQEFGQRLSQQGMTLELYLQYTGMELSEFRKTFREQAQRQVRIQLALEKIVELEEITPSEEDLNKEYARLAELYQMEEKQLREIIPAENLTHDVATNKAIDLIRDSADITEKDAEEVKKEESTVEPVEESEEEPKE